MESLFHPAMDILKELEKAGYEAYIVGGAVRDHLLQRSIHDVDITTSAPPLVIKQLFPKTIDVAIKHGTVIVRHLGHSFEVTQFKGSSLVEDLKSRDFTMNAMAFSNKREIIDPYCGAQDIEKQLVRAVKSAKNRFVEDPLRMLRAIRFVSYFSFSIEKHTLEEIKNCGNQICNVAIERIAVELEKIWLGKYVERAFDIFFETKILTYIEQLSPVQMALSDRKIVTALKKLRNATEVWTLLLFVSKQQGASNFLLQWKLPNKLIAEVELILSRLIPILKQGFTLEDYYYFGLETCKKAERVRAAFLDEEADLKGIEVTFKHLPIKERKELALKGNDVALLLQKEDPKSKIGQLIVIAEKAVVTKKVENEKSAIINLLRREGFIDAK